MQEKRVSLGCVISVVLWVMAFIFTAVGTTLAFVLPDNHAPALAFMCHALLLAAAAGTWTVRMFFERQNHLLRSAFKLGQEAGSVRQFRR